MNIDKQPNPRLHFYISIVKSGLRIAAGYYLIKDNVSIAGAFFIVAEILGILEEMF